MTAKVFLSSNRKKRLEKGHPWIFQSEIGSIEGQYEPGDIVEVCNHKGQFLAKGYINPQSQIMVRVLTYDSEENIDPSFFKTRIQKAVEYRQRFLTDTHSYRAIYGEADFLPGLVVDKFEDILVVQILSLGMELRKDWIKEALLETFNPRGIYLRNDVPVRELEGLAQEKGFWHGEFHTEVEIIENGLKYIIDVKEGQKTGFFFDQRENRAAIAPLMKGWGGRSGIRLVPLDQVKADNPDNPKFTQQATQTLDLHGQPEWAPVNKNGNIVQFPYWDGATVLECFAHTGSFTLNACKHGAKKVTCLDISDHAIQTAKKNVELNGFTDRVDFVVANAFDYLREQVAAGRTWDVVILDPPAFAKSKGAVKSACRGYKDINLHGLKLVNEGGFLVTASCSFHMSPQLFRETLEEAAQDAKKILRVVHWSGAGIDHPEILGVNEGHYLKFAIFEVRSQH
ncbi:class I SAM-dependent rRNA methyltransferase [Ammoniphilus sp. YIM 78166]|uniref:class I SAM-dependent rRNA methyltransferase n=1 Tax=Ammoniphilus sp. YIM 78166 TaxID=1644106 RepID=UPI0010701243|nr:class I SAM-dependent rRNA methyltransferase [Ammoniphilus sp. YIM 78166]